MSDLIIYFGLPDFILLLLSIIVVTVLILWALGRRLRRPFLSLLASPLGLLEALPWGVIVAHDDGQVVTINREGRELWGAVSRLEGPLDALRREMVDARQAVTRVLDSPRGIRLQVRAVPLPSSPETLFFLEDVSARHRQQEFYRHFISNVSHELKTPLTVIQGHMSQMGDNVGSDAWQTSRRIIVDETARLTQLVDNLLLLSRLESSDFVLHCRPVSVEAVVEDAILELSQAAETKDISLGLQRSEGLPRIMADRARFKQVFINLLDNAIKYTDEGGNVTISLSFDDKWLIAQVADSGEGIPAQDLPYIFEKMYRVERSGKPRVEGSGLGLSIVQRIVEQHGGAITVESEINRGTTFTITLPRS